ncbi:MAG: hypothetical protein OXG92_05830 [Chloroflexi bacterium]|nr:hypothetical protein [Chloroflexota bacterium]MCY3583197.1 hypothetical protein [Chloroflexota bacterium]MCY3715966.1 hypothetical protein [Chloroflexota bacterium]MDE2651537.1 hypothetical protein [Chloroflexota bacterium]MXV93501.1 hypothetical protein [Chloroflexota bacterium]
MPLSPRHLLATALLSASAMCLEVALTRLLSLLYFPPYVFLALSLAIFGIGMGAALPALRKQLTHADRLAQYCLAAAASSLLLAILCCASLPLQMPALILAALTLPFLCVGLALSVLFSLHAAHSRLLYMGDLVGAGLGVVLVIPLLNRFGALDVMLVTALGFALAAYYLSARGGRMAVLAGLAVGAVIFGANVNYRFLHIDMTALAAEKPIVSALAAGGEIIETRWDAFARSDLLDPGDGGALRIYVDGGAASIMPEPASLAEHRRDIGFFPFATERPARVFIIGPGAGLDVYFALQGRARSITAVEVNGASVDMTRAMSSRNGAVYDQPNVTVLMDDGRGALRRSKEKYDLIFLSQVVSLAAERGGYALSENVVYTADAFADYLAHLTAGGQLALKLYDEATLTRALATAIEALRRQGKSDAQALEHLLAFLDERAENPVPLLMVGAQPYTRDDSLALGAIAREVGFSPLLLPHVLVQPPLDEVAIGAKTFAETIAAAEADYSPPTDDRPYFFQFERGIPSNLQPLALLIPLGALGLALLCISLWRSSRSLPRSLSPVYVALLGIGFIALEIYAIQQTRLFLGHPTWAVALALFTFLLGGGIGSGLSQVRLRATLSRFPAVPAVLAVVLALAWSALWALLSRELITASLFARLLVALASLLPLALIMGIPFPQALAEIAKLDRRGVAIAWSVNGVATVAGSICAVILSITVGFGAALWLGAAAYALAALIRLLMRRAESPA